MAHINSKFRALYIYNTYIYYRDKCFFFLMRPHLKSQRHGALSKSFVRKANTLITLNTLVNLMEIWF